jgi:CheY-like chemotaxis protein
MPLVTALHGTPVADEERGSEASTAPVPSTGPVLTNPNRTAPRVVAGRSRRVLVVDCDGMAREGVMAEIRSLGHQGVRVSTPELGLAFLRINRDVALVIVASRTFDAQGAAFIERLRQFGPSAPTPVIVVSPHVSIALVRHVLGHRCRIVSSPPQSGRLRDEIVFATDDGRASGIRRR